ncbi:MAG TPA: hypothetical protein VGM90_17730 [Kofleriaceae bacterium]|jgi:hypothetical protein
MRTILLAFLVTVAGCYESVHSTSLNVIPREQSGAVLAKPPIDAARDVANVLQTRGYVLAEQGKAAGGVQMKFVAGVAVIRDYGHTHSTVGSVMYALVLPAPGGSTVSFVGKPTLDGEEACGVTDTECTSVSAPVGPADGYMTGETEAAVIHSALAQLQLDGLYVAPLPANAPLYVAPERSRDPICLANRKQVLDEASRTQNLDERGKLVRSAPNCPATVDPVGTI